MIYSLTIVSSLLFIIYGLLCITSQHMVAEFERYGLSQFRTLVGYLELAGGLGQIIGYYYSQYLFAAASLGLVTLMFMALILRLRLQDPYLEIIPAAVLFVINAYLLYDLAYVK